jgi:hypothetical protein
MVDADSEELFGGGVDALDASSRIGGHDRVGDARDDGSQHRGFGLGHGGTAIGHDRSSLVTHR